MDFLSMFAGQWISQRLREPSTWKGLAVLAGVAGVNINPDLVVQIGSAVAMVIGSIEVGRKEY